MKDQVTSIEQSKRLIELEVPAQKASMVWEIDEDCARLKIWNTDEKTRRILHSKYPDYYAPAYTVADILELLPMFIERKGIFHLNITPCCEGWYAGYKTERGVGDYLLSGAGTGRCAYDCCRMAFVSRL